MVFFASCNEQGKKHSTEDSASAYHYEPKINAAPLPLVSNPAGDPYFIESKDVVSPYGPSGITRNILQDKNGDIWFASWQGIIRYDGKVFTNMTLKEGLVKYHVFSVLEDKRGDLWFGTIGAGVYRYNPASGRFTLFTSENGLSADMVLCIAEDAAGNTWIGTGKGVSRYDGKTFTNFKIDDGLSSNEVTAIARDKTGKLWFGTRSGVDCYDPSGKASFTKFTDDKGKTFTNVRSIIEDKKGNIWIGSQDGLWRCDPLSGMKTKLTSNFIGYIFEDRTGNIWLSEGTLNGAYMTLSRYNGNTFTKIDSSRQVFGIIEDGDNNIWFGTENGISRYDGKSFTNFLE